MPDDQMAHRLRSARQKAGYPNATEAARRYGWTPSTYLSHENGTRGITLEAARRYARAFRVPLDWLLGLAAVVDTPSSGIEDRIKVSPLRLRLGLALAHVGWSEADLARAVSVRTSTIAAVADGDLQRPPLIAAIAQALGLRAGQLIGSEPLPDDYHVPAHTPFFEAPPPRVTLAGETGEPPDAGLTDLQCRLLAALDRVAEEDKPHVIEAIEALTRAVTRAAKPRR